MLPELDDAFVSDIVDVDVVDVDGVVIDVDVDWNSLFPWLNWAPWSTLSASCKTAPSMISSRMLEPIDAKLEFRLSRLGWGT